MASLRPLLELLPDERIRDLVGSRAPITAPDPARPYLLAAMATHLGSPILAVCARAEESEHLARDIHAFLGRDGAEVFPGWEVLPGEPISPSVDTMGRRAHVLARLQRGETFVICTSAQGLTQLVATSAFAVMNVDVGLTTDLDETATKLVEMGYERNYMVERRGEFAIRGGILDIFPPSCERPVRIELWGDEITSLREFALASQRSLGDIPPLEIAPARELRADSKTRDRAAALAKDDNDPALAQLADGIIVPGAERLLPRLTEMKPLTDLLPAGAPIVICEPKRVRDRAEEVLDQVAEWAELAGVTEVHYVSLDDVLADRDTVVLMSALPTPSAFDLEISTWNETAGKPELLAERVGKLVADGYRAVVAASLEDTAKRIGKNLKQLGHPFEFADQAPGADAPANGSIVVAELNRGFVLPSAKLALVAESDLTGRRSGAARKRIHSKRKQGTGPLDLALLDLVVHEVHGIGRYQGMVERELLGQHREYMVIEYAKGDKLYVPSDQVDLVSKYIGGEAPRMSRLGSSDWGKTKSRVRKQARQIATDLVKLYGERMGRRGFIFPADTPWQRELEDAFPYEETPDQARAIDEIKDDMESPKVMDRLVCGDVGYGKTEVAVRAAFKAVAAGKQVAVLVPTTILAQQHHATFSDRMRGFPVRVEMLSRFLSPSESKKIIEDVREGKVDVIVGTHRLLGKDVSFKDVGLVIVDEEQRFGVDQKERLKELRTNVDVLTLTATPIPRTLEMALSGIREMSVIDTPPEDRHPVMTYVGELDDMTIASAIRRELLRDGQVFYVHPRVRSINEAARRVEELVPDARVAIAHGQMDEHALEQSMVDFADAKTNVLVCSTIIESGLDMPTVNTMIVERADLLGLSQMYQLRGRVGRAHERAYAYLFYPPDRSLTEAAHERLKTVSEHTGLGSGFRIAMRDLEIRGAGNLLGGEQSGHISEVGFDLYVKIMASAVDEAKGLPWQEEGEVRIDLPLQAFIPKSYISDENLRLEMYRRIASVRDGEDLDEVRSELTDRYGAPLPETVESLFEVAELRAVMMGAGIQEAATVAKNLRIKPIDLPDSKQVRLQRLLPQAEWKPTTATLLIPDRNLPKVGVVRWVIDLLKQLTSTG